MTAGAAVQLPPAPSGHEAHGATAAPCAYDCVHCHQLVRKFLRGFIWWDCRVCPFRRWIGRFPA